MKKATVYNWLCLQKDKITRKEKNPAIRAAKLAALRQCEKWLFDLTWAQMRAPLRAKREDIAAEGLPLITKQKKDPTSLTKEETNCLNELVASDAVYEQFENKITPTARQAEIEVKMRQREQERRAAFRQERKGR